MEKIDIKKHNLSSYAQEFYGWTMTHRATKKNPVLESGADRIVIKCQPDGNYTFFSPTSNHRGSIIDFTMWQENTCDVKEASRTAYQKITGFVQDVQAGRKTAPEPVKPVKEFDQKKLEELRPAKYHSYLASRGLDNLDHGRFKGTVMYDPQYKNAVFPHKNDAGEIVGYSIKNSNFNGFSPGGHKTLWRSNQFANDNKLVVCEAGIDALSYAKLMDRKPEGKKELFNTCFISTEGAYSPEVMELLRHEIEALPEGATVVGAFDNDDKGWEFNSSLKDLCECVGRKYKTDIPRVKRYDWNDVLQKYLEHDKEQTQGSAPAAQKEKNEEEDMTCQR